MMKFPHSLITVLLLGLATTASSLAQQVPGSKAPTEEPGYVFKTESRTVPVEAVVTNKHDKYVRNLSAKDFEILADGQPQQITSFSAGGDKTSQNQNYMVLYFDNLTTSLDDQRMLRQQALKFLQAKSDIHPLIAMVDFDGTPTITQNFTNDTSLLAKAVSTLKSGVQEKTVKGFGASSDYSAVDYGARALMLSLQNLAQNLAAIPGRKVVVLFSKGFPFTQDRKVDLDLLSNTCARADVAIYTVDSSGVAGPGNAGSVADVSGPTRQGLGLPGAGGSYAPSAMANAQTNAANQQILIAIADETGGTSLMNSNDFEAVMRRAAEDEVQTYTLGFVPPPAADGSCHKIQIKLNHSGDTVRGRTMYCNVKPPEALAGKPIEGKLETSLKTAGPSQFAGTMRTSYFYKGPNEARVNVDLAVSPRGLQFERQKGKLHSQLDVLGIAYRPDGSIGGRFSDSVGFDIPDDNTAVQRLLAQSVRYEKQFGLAPGDYDLKVAFSSDGEKFGRAEQEIKIANYDGKSLALSGIALSRMMRPVSMLMAGGPEVLSNDNSPLVANGMEVIPAATDHFEKTQPLAFYVEVYDPALMEAHPPKLGVVLQIVDVKTGQPVKSSGLIDVTKMIRPGSAIVPVGINLPVSALAPGQYKLLLQAGNSAGKRSPIQETEFVLE